MTDDTQQPVVTDDKGAAQPAPAANDAPDLDSLDSLLKQYDEATRKPADTAAAATPDKAKPAEAKPADSNALAEQVKRLAEFQEAEIRQRTAKSTKEALDATVHALKGDLPDDPAVLKFVRGWLKDTADSDPRLQKAFQNREEDPASWNKIVNGLTRECQKEFAALSRKPDAAATEDREAVTASLRGASTAPPPTKEPDITRMSDAELRKHNREKYGYEPNF